VVTVSNEEQESIVGAIGHIRVEVVKWFWITLCAAVATLSTGAAMWTRLNATVEENRQLINKNQVDTNTLQDTLQRLNYTLVGMNENGKDRDRRIDRLEAK